MKKRTLLNYSLFIFTALFLLQSCEEEKMAVDPPPTESTDFSYREEFDSMQRVVDMGWRSINLSDPNGGQGWRQGSYVADNVKGGPFYSRIPSYSYKVSANEHALAPYTVGAGLSFINCWLVTPPLMAKNGDEFSFWTRTASPVNYPDRMQVWVNPHNDGVNVGRTPNETGDFTMLMLDLNPSLTSAPFNPNNIAGSGYPQRWTKFSYSLGGLPQGNTPKRIRIGFRYYVKDGGPSGAVSDEIAIDDFEFISN